MNVKTLFNPCEWQMRLLGLKIYEEPQPRRGLILIQIDGLSFPDFQQALKKRHMLFLRKLMRREHYQLWPLYSGIPSNTPAFQGEFFFGQPQCVPSFQFLDKPTGKIFTMFNKSSAAEVEGRLLQKDKGLLAGGSAYGNIFAGGAAESYVCASTADWTSAWKAWNPYSFLVSFIFNPFTMIRGVLLCLTESVLALVDFFRGFMSGQDIVQELMFIFTRVLSSILIRDVGCAHALMDIYRGLPVIHLNYFGYDEQAHRRGPSTRFAYWGLSGIDHSIKQIWHAAVRATRCHYDVWIYSDHGQEPVTPFARLAGKRIQQAAEEIYEEVFPRHCEEHQRCDEAISEHRGHWGDTVMGNRGPNGDQENKDRPLVTTLGPISQIYFPVPLSEEEKEKFAKRLLEKYSAIPLIVLPLANGEVKYETHEGTYRLPQDAERLFGVDHPYLREVAEDLGSLCRHESRGDLILFGWRAGMPAVTFSNENGAHAGLGPRETQAFALLPVDAPLQKKPGDWIRALDLRQAALVAIGKKKRERRAVSSGESPTFRVMSYNVHSCVGLDRILSVERIARIIAKANPDVVALQELDVGRRFKGADQAAAIAKELEMHFHFHPVCGAESECFGNAVLSHYPIKVIRAEHLPMISKSPFLEPRGILWVEIDFQGRKVHLLNTHLSIWGPEQEIQIQKLLGPDYLGSKELGEDVILCGDFNVTPRSKLYKRIAGHFKEPATPKNYKGIRNTWTSQWPVRRLDHILMRGHFEAEVISLPRTRLESCASDHLPVAADFRFNPK